MKRSALPIAIVVGATLMLSACSKDQDPAPALPPVASAPATTAAAAAPAVPTAAATAPADGAMSSYSAGQGQSGYQDGSVTLRVSHSQKLGAYVVDGDGFTLYRFDQDSPNPSTSNCNDACATTWPPTLAAHTVKFAGLDRSALGVVARQDGSVQMTVGKWPVYRFSKDTGPGQLNGQGVGGTWFAVAPDGSKAGQK